MKTGGAALRLLQTGAFPLVFGPFAGLGFRPIAMARTKSKANTDSSANLGFILKYTSDMRHALIEADLVDCMVGLPGQLFYSARIPVCLSFIGKRESSGKCPAVLDVEIALVA